MPRLCLKPLIWAAFFLSFCSAALAEGHYKHPAKSDRTTTTVHIVWLKNFSETDTLCRIIGGDYGPREETILGCFHHLTSTIYAVEPTSFNDSYHLTILGHEFWHALGALHPEK